MFTTYPGSGCRPQTEVKLQIIFRAANAGDGLVIDDIAFAYLIESQVVADHQAGQIWSECRGAFNRAA